MTRVLNISKRLLPYLLILAFSIFGTWLFMYDGLNIGDDYFYHLPSILDKYESALNGNGLGGISSQIGNGLGYGASLFYSPLSHYFIVVLALIFKPFGISLLTSYKLAFIFVVFLSGVFMYRFALKFTSGNKVASLISSACLVLYPYRLFNLFCRLAIAEAFAFTFIPLFLCGLYEVVHMDKDKIRTLPFVKIVLGASLLFLSHNLTALFVFIVGILYLLISIPRLLPLFRSGRFWSYASTSVCLIFGICSIALLPQLELLNGNMYAINDSSIMRTDVSHVISHVGKEWYYSGFLNVSFLQGLGYSSSSLYSGIALYIISCLLFCVLDSILAKISALKIAHYFISGTALFIAVSIVYGRLEIYLAAIVFFALYVLASRSKEESKPIQKNVLFWFCSVGIFAVICIMASADFWEKAPSFLLKIQFPWRLWSLVQIFVSILVGLLASHFAKRKLAVCILSVFVGLLLVLNMPILEKRSEGADEWQSEITEAYLDNISSLGHHKEYAPVIFQQNDYIPHENSLYYDVKNVLYKRTPNDLEPVFLSGKGEITVVSKSAPVFEMEITALSDAKIQLPLLYYNGYKIYVNGEKMNPECVDGLVSFELSAGTYTVSTNFVGSGARITGRVLTAVCSILSLGALGYGIYAETDIKRLFKKAKK